ARTAAYQARLAGTRTLILLDNAAGAGQVGPLLPGTAGCPVLITSRGSLADLDAATHLAVDVFSPDEATALLAHAAAGAPAEADLHHLGRDHLLQAAAAGRYTLHDLVRGYAADRAGDEDPPPVRRAALTRLFDYYLATAATAMDTLYPAETHRRPRILPPGTPMPVLTNPDTARAWLDTERPN